MNKHIKAILFDVGGTILFQSKSFYSMLKPKFENLENLPSLKKYDDLLKENLLKSTLSHNHDIWSDNSCIDKELHNLYLKVLIQLKIKNATDLADYLVEEIKSAETWTPANNLLETLLFLKKRGYILGVISNWGDALPLILKEHGILENLDICVYSSKIGSSKPDNKIFSEAINQLKKMDSSIGYNNVLIVGDSYKHDIKPALNLGMIPLWIDSNVNDVRDRNVVKVDCISKMVELLD